MTALLTTAGYELIALAYAGFSGIIFRARSRSPVSSFFLAAVVTTAVWAQLFVLAYYDIVPMLPVLLLGAARDGAWLAFSLAIIYPVSGSKSYWYASTAAAAGLITSQLILYSTGLALGGVAGVSIDIALFKVVTTIMSFVLIENALSNASRASIWALKHWAIGLSAILAFQLVVRIPEFLTHTVNRSIALADPLVILLALPFFVVSSARLPQLQLRIHSSRTFVFHTATLIAIGVLLQGTAFAAWYVRSYGGTDGTALAIVVGFSGIVGVAAALVSGTVRSRLRLLINKHLFNLRYDYRVEWERAIRSLTANTEKNAAERALRILCDLLDAPGGAIWLYQESWRQFKLCGKFGVAVNVSSLRESDERVELLRQDERPFMAFSANSPLDPLFTVFKAFIDGGWIVVPLRHRSALAGFIVLNKPRVSRGLDWEDESLVGVLGMQLAAYLVQEETAQALADARQLADFNKRFAFVVHDIKNTIGQLSLLVRNVTQFGDQEEFRDDMVITLGHSVSRLEILLKSLTDVGTRASAGGDGGQVFDMAQLLKGFAFEKRRLGYRLDVSLPDAPTNIRTDPIALSRVLDHVVANAFEASGADAPVEIDLSINEDAVEIVVTDHGTGMTQQFINEELFRPLRTTKHGGFGVGGYQIRELMRDLGGDVNVESVVGSGTLVKLTLPANVVAVK